MNFVLFGSTGDLARLKLLPALKELSEEGALGNNPKLFAVGRRDYDTKQYLKYLQEVEFHPFTEDIGELNPKYVKVDFDAQDGFGPLFSQLDLSSQTLFYFSVGPDVVELILSRLEEFLNKIQQDPPLCVLEKPYADNKQQTQEFISRINHLVGEENLFLVDHYLHKPTVKSLREIRLQDQELNQKIMTVGVKHINLLMAEEIEVGDRFDYFDCRGIVQDIFQNHMLQILGNFCVSPQGKIFNSKFEFLNSLQVAKDSIVRAQYEGYGSGYKHNPACQTETFLGVKLKSNDPEWEDTEFRLIGGKALSQKEFQLNIKFKDGSTESFDLSNATGSEILEENDGKDYQRVMLDVLSGDHDFFVSEAEAILQWELTEKVMGEMSDTELKTYPKQARWSEICGGTWCAANSD